MKLNIIWSFDYRELTVVAGFVLCILMIPIVLICL